MAIAPPHPGILPIRCFVIMPNYIHGILVLADETRRDAALGNGSKNPTENFHSNATPNPHRSPSELGVAFGRKGLANTNDDLPNAAPLPLRLGVGTVGAIVLNFKSVTFLLNYLKASVDLRPALLYL
jgi:hypothetical protein